jgi:CheY-like chemotaxis protein
LHAQSTPRIIHRREVGALAVVEPSPWLSRLLERYLRGIAVVQVPTVDEMITRALGSSIEAALINESVDHNPLPAQWPQELRHMPVLRCYAPMAGQVLNLPRSPHGHLAKPITRDKVYEALSEMLCSPAIDFAKFPMMERNSRELRKLGQGKSARILVVDDDEDTLQMMSRMLRLTPADVRGKFESVIPVRARSGEQALELLRATGGAAINGIFLDLVLDGMSGFDVLREMETDDCLRQIPVCLVSGYLVSGDPLITPYLELTRRDGLSVNELAQAIAALLGIVLPGLEVNVSYDVKSHG